MLKNQCSRCLKFFKYNYLLKKHLDRKNICKLSKTEIKENNDTNKNIELDKDKDIDFEEFINLIRTHMKDYNLLNCILDSYINKIKKKKKKKKKKEYKIFKNLIKI